MPSQFRPVFLLLVATVIKSAVSDGYLEYGVTQAQKVIKGVCWYENLKNPTSDCHKDEDYLERLKSLESNPETPSPSLPPTSSKWKGKGNTHHGGSNPSFQINAYIRTKFLQLIPSYGECVKFFKGFSRPQSARHKRHLLRHKLHQRPRGCSKSRQGGHARTYVKPKAARDYGWLLGGKIHGGCLFKQFNYCVLGLFEDKHGKEALNELKTHWDESASTKEEVKEIEEENQEGTVTEDEQSSESEEEIEGGEGGQERESQGSMFQEETEVVEYQETVIEEEFDENGNLIKRTQHIKEKV